MEPKNNKKIITVVGIVLAIATAIIVGIVITQAAPESRLKKQLNRAEKYLAEFNYEQALVAYEEAVKIDSKCERAYLAMADIYIEQGRVEKAVAILEEGQKIIPTDTIAGKLKEVKNHTTSADTSKGEGQQATKATDENKAEMQKETKAAITEPATEVKKETPVQTKETVQNATERPAETVKEISTEAPTEKPSETIAVIPTVRPIETTAFQTESTVNNQNDDDGEEETTQAATQRPTESTTQVATQRPTEGTTQAATQRPTESTTQAPTQRPTESTTQVPTQSPTESTTQAAPVEVPSANVGEYITFGKYEQDNDTSNGAESIEWLVLDNQGDRMLVISRYGLDCQPYNTTNVAVTWETCTLRNWLNTEFYNTAFSDSEKASVITTTVENPNNARRGTQGGNATSDNVFCLSIDEANRYFASDESRATKPTAYAVSRGAYASTSTNWYAGNCVWWLRSPGYFQDDAADVYDRGYVRDDGNNVYHDVSAVRPAMWIAVNP